jgi:hypothetical protein
MIEYIAEVAVGIAMVLIAMGVGLGGAWFIFRFLLWLSDEWWGV